MTIRYVSEGENVTLEMPFSEVCMHMRIAGTVRTVRTGTDVNHNCAYLVNKDGSSGPPMLMSEAGFYRDVQGWYYHDA